MTEIGVHPETAPPAAARQHAPRTGKIHIRLSDWIGSAKRMMKRRKLLPKLRLRKKGKKVKMAGSFSFVSRSVHARVSSEWRMVLYQMGRVLFA